MRKRNIISIIILSLIMNSLIMGIYFLQNSTEQENINENSLINPVVAPDSKINSITSIDSATVWFERETVKVKYDPKDRFISPSKIFSECSDQADTIDHYGLLYAMKDDSVMYRVGVYDDSGNDEAKGDINFFFKSDSLSGTLYYDFFVKVFGSPNSQSPYYDSTFEITDDYADGEGFLNILLQFHGLPTERFARIIIFNFETNNFEVIVEDQTAISLSSVNSCFVYIDELRFSPDVISSNIKSTYQYTSDTIISHKLSIPSFDYNTEITIYKPTHWIYSSITPSCDIELSSNDVILTNTVPMTYEMLFTSNSTYFLALEKTTTNYISSTESNFEGGTMGGWFDYRQYLGESPMDTFEVSTDISQEGYHSLHIETSTDAYPTAALLFDQTETVNLAEGFYLSFWYYWVTTDTFRFSVRNELDNAWISYTLPTTVTDRWIRYCEFYEGSGISGSLKSVEFYGADASSTMEIYFDNFEIMTISTEISTVDYPSKYEISSTFVSCDGYQNPVLINEEVTFELWDRTTQTEISSYETTTNSLGVASWTYESSLEQKEYMIRSYTCNNRFGDYATKELSDTWDFNEGDADGWDGYQSPTVSNGLAYWEVTPNRIRNTFDYENISFVDYPDIIMRYRTNETDHYLKSTAGFDYSTNNYLNPDGNWHIWTKRFVDSFLILQSFLSIRCNNPSWIYVDYILLVENSFFSEFYFTPSYPYNVDYFETIETDEIDFSEGDGEGFSIGTDTYVIVNGLMNCSSTVSSGNNYLSYSFAYDLSASGYSSMYIRAKVKTGRQAAIQIKDTTSGYGISHSFTDTWKTSLYVFTDSRLYDSDSLQMVIWDSENGDNTESLYVFVDFIRLVHVEEPETFLTNTYLGFGSENDKWISAVYSDNIFLGFYNDPNLVYLNQTLGTHNISRLPVARQGETKAFLYSNLYTYTYQVSEPDNYFILLNPPSFDIDAGLIYIDLATYYGNCTYRVMMNESWLGSSVPEGSSVWECDFSSAGFYNFTVYVYQGATVWSTLTSSITIPESEPAEELQLQFLLKDVDTSVSQIFVNYYTNWQNTSLILFDNSTQLGTELSGEGASIWSFSQVEYYAFHNISICIYHNSVLEFTYYFSFVIQEPIQEEEEGLSIEIWNKDVDIANKLISVNIRTNWQNQSIRIFDNSTELTNGYQLEGAMIVSFENMEYYAFHNISICLYNNLDLMLVEYFSFSIIEPIPKEPEELQLLFLTKDVDTSVSQIFVNYYTNWENTSLICFDNQTQLGTELSGEGASIWSFSQVEYYAFHNISICIYHNSVLQFVYYFSFTIQEPALEPENYYTLLNPPSYDIDAGLIYIDLATYYGNCTYLVMMNESWLGSSVPEGSSVWECDFSSAGFYNFTVYVYQGATVWSTLTSSITIPKPTPAEELTLLLLTKDVDTSTAQVFVNYYTNWENTTLIVFDNSTQLGTELSGEGASIWSFSQVEYYAFHNISICIYHNSVLQFIYYFSFTIQEPALEPENYYTLLNPPSYDIDAGLIYIDLCTYYQNCTYRLKMNSTWLGEVVDEGSSVWECDFSSAGFYNFSCYVYNGAEIWDILTTSLTIPEQESESLVLEVWNKDVDVAAGLIYVNAITSWGNQSVRLQDNSTWLGDYTTEGASIWLFPTTFGLHNISIWLYNGLTPMFVEYFSFTIQEPSLEIFTVHFDLFTIAGIGLPFETAKIYVNDSRIYNPQQYYFKDSFIEVKVRDYYNHLLFATNATITANRDIALYVRLFMQQIRNSYDIPVEVYFISTFDSNYNHSYIVVAEGSISVLLFSSSYHVLVKPLQDEYQNSTHITYFYATTSEYQDLGDETKSYSITMETDLEPLDLEEPKGVRAWPAWVLLANSIIINAILISFIGAMGKWGIVKVWNYGLYYPNKGANWVLRKFGSEKELHWCVEHKGGLEFVTPEQYKKAEALKEEGQF